MRGFKAIFYRILQHPVPIPLLIFTLIFISYLNHLRYPSSPNLDLQTTTPSIRQVLKDVYISPAAQKLPKRGLLFCFVTTIPRYHATRAQTVVETWLQRCDHGELFTSNSSWLPEVVPYRTIYRNLNDTYEELFWKSKISLFYVFTHISPNFDWYLKADDDTYVITENLRAYLASFDASKPHYIGFRMKPYLKDGYNSGGAGYVLSRQAMRIFAEILYYDESLCKFNEFEDVGIGKCLANAGIYPTITSDVEGRQRFLPYDFQQVYEGMLSSKEAEYWFKEKPKKGNSAFTPDLISIHHITPDTMRALELSLYKIRISSTT
ncbi:hypothetical protein L596_009734 [Steinernema carpocapsae]|uniref:N-acetylgalactosaminide beta-1,3-galactosyltransferase n=1 Tax=Steinernema carpocapsae TaxID=34508 RepID=A0A4U5PGI9_STECR|nr:hypothetical protein L596_009734 [Steinernema carpocapsae]